MLHDTNSHELLSVVSAIHHERVRQTFDDGTLCFSESLNGISASGVRDVDRSADLNVVAAFQKMSVKLPPPRYSARLKSPNSLKFRKLDARQRDIPNFNILITPLVEQLDRANLIGDFLGENAERAVGDVDLDFAVVRHGGD